MKNFILLGLLLTFKNSEIVFGSKVYEKCVYTSKMEMSGAVDPAYYDCIEEFGESNCSMSDYMSTPFFWRTIEHPVGRDECNRDGDDSYYIGHCDLGSHSSDSIFGIKFDQKLTEEYVVQDKIYSEGCGYNKTSEFGFEILCIKKKEGQCKSPDRSYLYFNNKWLQEAKGLNATKITDFEEVTITAKPSFPTIIPEKKERCGEGIGPCKNGECCSKKGWCGKTEKHCNIKEGCQTKFGMCQFKSKATETLSLKKCGKNVGSCEEGFCCSKLGLCVKNSDNNNCDTSKGCQPEFGECH